MRHRRIVVRVRVLADVERFEAEGEDGSDIDDAGRASAAAAASAVMRISVRMPPLPGGAAIRYGAAFMREGTRTGDRPYL